MAYTKQNFTDGQVLKAEHLNNIEDGIVNQTYDDLKDKPFGDELVEVVSEMTFVGEEMDGVFFVMLPPFPAENTPILVTFDGVEYDCPYRSSIYGVGGYGNLDIMFMDGEYDTGEPFYIEPSGIFAGAPLIAVSDANSHTLSISGTSVKKIKSKYVDACSTFYTNNTDGGGYIYTDMDCTNIATKEDVWNASMSGTVNVKFMLNNTVLLVAQPIAICNTLEYVTVSLSNWNTSSVADRVKMYVTAEYTPTT